MKESKFQTQVKKYLESIGAEVFIMTSGAFTIRGISDIVGTLPHGRALYVEVKTTSGTTPYQRNFLRRMGKLGAFVAVVYPEPRRRSSLYDDDLYPEGFDEMKARLENEGFSV